MTLERVSVEKCRSLEQCQPSDLYDPFEGSGDHSVSGPEIQCLNRPWSGPVVEAEWEYVDPRQGAFDGEPRFGFSGKCKGGLQNFVSALQIS